MGKTFLTIMAVKVTIKKESNFPGGPVAKTLCSQRRGPGFDPLSGN